MQKMSIRGALEAAGRDIAVKAVVVDVDSGACQQGATILLFDRDLTSEEVASSGWQGRQVCRIHRCDASNRDLLDMAKALWPTVKRYDAHCSCCCDGLDLVSEAA